MTPIRPGYPQHLAQPQTQQRAPNAGGGIFELARAQAAARQAPTAEVAPTVQQPAPVNRVAEAQAEPPQRVLRPGSLLDIRV